MVISISLKYFHFWVGVLLITSRFPKKEIAGDSKEGYIYSQRRDIVFVLYMTLYQN